MRPERHIRDAAAAAAISVASRLANRFMLL